MELPIGANKPARSDAGLRAQVRKVTKYGSRAGKDVTNHVVSIKANPVSLAC